MFTGSMMKLKSILYGTLPFYYTKVFEPSSPKLAYYDYFEKEDIHVILMIRCGISGDVDCRSVG